MVRLLVLALVLLLVAVACRRQPEPVPPVADAGPIARTTLVGQAVALDAAGSTTTTGATPAFRWSLRQAPAGSSASLTGADQAAASLVPDVAGQYRVELTVTVGNLSDTAETTVTAVAQPVASAGGDQIVDVGDRVILDSSGSSHGGGASSREWELLAVPDGSALTGLQNPTGVEARFTPDLNGAYTVQFTLTVAGFSASDVAVIQVNGPPVAATGPAMTGQVGTPAPLDGQASSDPDGDALTYSWTIESAPAGSTAAILEADQPLASFTPDVVGNYFFGLTVSDGRLSDSTSLSLQVQPAGGVPLTTVHVATDGDDSASGTQDAPLQTIQAALDLAATNPDVSRIQLAAGTYDQEPFGYDVGRDIQILGPEGPEPGATLASSGTLFNVQDSARLVLLRLAIETTGVAINVESGSGLVLIASTCRAGTCINAGSLFGSSGGSVSVQDSQLRAFSQGDGNGITSWSGDGVQVGGSTVQGFNNGLYVFGGTITILDTELLQNHTGAFLTGTVSGVMRETLVGSSQLGLQLTLAANIRLQDIVVDGANTYGISMDAGAVLLMEGGSLINVTRGLLLGPDLSYNERASLRGVLIDSADHSVVVEGASSVLDLGTGTQAGDNNLKAASTTSYPLFDDREAGATGLIQLSDTTLNGWQLDADTYTGVYQMSGRLRITAAGNSVIVQPAP